MRTCKTWRSHPVVLHTPPNCSVRCLCIVPYLSDDVSARCMLEREHCVRMRRPTQYLNNQEQSHAGDVMSAPTKHRIWRLMTLMSHEEGPGVRYVALDVRAEPGALLTERCPRHTLSLRPTQCHTCGQTWHKSPRLKHGASKAGTVALADSPFLLRHLAARSASATTGAERGGPSLAQPDPQLPTNGWAIWPGTTKLPRQGVRDWGQARTRAGVGQPTTRDPIKPWLQPADPPHRTAQQA